MQPACNHLFTGVSLTIMTGKQTHVKYHRIHQATQENPLSHLYNVTPSETSFFNTTWQTTIHSTQSRSYRSNKATLIPAELGNTRAVPTLTGIFAPIFVTTANVLKMTENRYSGCKNNTTNTTKLSNPSTFAFITL
jgi:hypothetical protein